MGYNLTGITNSEVREKKKNSLISAFNGFEELSG